MLSLESTVVNNMKLTKLAILRLGLMMSISYSASAQDTLEGVFYQQEYEGGIYISCAYAVGDNRPPYISVKSNSINPKEFINDIDTVLLLDTFEPLPEVDTNFTRIELSNKRLIRAMNKASFSTDKIEKQFLRKMKIQYVIKSSEEGIWFIPDYGINDKNTPFLKEIKVTRLTVQIISIEKA